jgi:hypothetical protein
MYAETSQQKMKILGIRHWVIMMTYKTQPREHSKGGALDGVVYNSAQSEWQPQRPVFVLQGRQVAVELQLA